MTDLCNTQIAFDSLSDTSTEGEELNTFSLQKTGKQENAKNSKKKSSLCRNYAENGFCPYGFKCQFAHGLQELRCKVDENSYKTKPCNAFSKKGYCKYGFRCNFLHQHEDKPESN